MNESMGLLLGIGCLIVAWLEAKQTWIWYSTYRAIRQTKESPLDFLGQRKPGEFFEFNAPAELIASKSPVTDSACAAWEFEIWQVKPDRGSGSSNSVPVAVRNSEPQWLLFEGPSEIVGVRFDTARVEMSQTFTLHSVFNTDLPNELQNYLNSKNFKSGLTTLNNVWAFEPSMASTFRERILPAKQPLHVFGRVRELTGEEMRELQSYRSRLGLRKAVQAFTVDGEELSIGLKSEKNLLSRTRLRWLGHSAATLAVTAFACLFLYQYFVAF